MKENARFFTPSVLTKIIRSCLWMGILELFVQNCAAMDDDRRPNEHFCPITLQVMKDPVVAADGHSYERSAISEYFQSSMGSRSPITGLSLANQNLFDNQALKAMIMDWKPGRQGEPSALETRDAASIAERVREEFQRNAALLNSAKGKNIVAFLGNTGAGKSTLVNWLAGKELVVSEYGEDYVLAHPEDKTAMVIGTGGNSETLYPKFIDVEDLRFFDLPGFNDTDGTERNLVNAAFIRQILLDAASVRVVVVAGQDQFTADRSASVRQLFNAVKQLFVVEQGNINLIDDGVFVATKITCAAQVGITDFLLRRTDSRDKAALNDQLKSWIQQDRLSLMFHPLREAQNKDVRDQILARIKDTQPAKVLGINVSVLYPPDTKEPLERMFFSVLEGAFNHKLDAPLETLSDYDEAIASYGSGTFWSTFEADVREQDNAMELLKEFCVNPYNKALKRLEKENDEKRQKHIQGLRNRREKRIEDIERRTEARTQEVITSLVPQSKRNDFVAFDFAWHRDFHDQVCGREAILQLAIDPLEQEIVRSCYAGFISRHSHGQMMRWHEKFSGVEDLKKQLEATQQKLDALIKAHETQEAAQSEEKRRQEAERLEEAARQRIKFEMRLTVPPVARGYETIYERFLKGTLVYTPRGLNGLSNPAGMMTLPIKELANPLEGTFDLSRCGDTGKYLSIATGYRKGKKPENTNKVEIWFAPRFLIEKELNGTAAHFKPIIENWKQEVSVGMFWTWGGWDSMLDYDYLTTENIGNLSKIDLYKSLYSPISIRGRGVVNECASRDIYGRSGCVADSLSCFIFKCDI
jgi:GTP-binding protein EngB required for normal cell division